MGRSYAVEQKPAVMFYVLLYGPKYQLGGLVWKWQIASSGEKSVALPQNFQQLCPSQPTRGCCVLERIPLCPFRTETVGRTFPFQKTRPPNTEDCVSVSRYVLEIKQRNLAPSNLNENTSSGVCFLPQGRQTRQDHSDRF